VYYVNERPQLFDLQQDPDECQDLADSDDNQHVLEYFEHELRSILDPEGVDAQCKASQSALIESHGGQEAVLNRGAFDNSPVPGEAPAFRKHGSNH
jgi:choline-sulfatase